ncbi:MAG: YiiD C-terminal domain-containing protein [Thermomonas sp.]
MDSDSEPALQSLLAHYLSMPPVAAMQLDIAGADAGSLRLCAPLAAHVNDKGCAFGGSLVSLMTLAGWGVATLALERAGLHADVFVASSEVRYRAPLFADLEAVAMADPAALAAFVATLRDDGRASLHIEARVPLPAGGRACDMRSRYVAIARG